VTTVGAITQSKILYIIAPKRLFCKLVNNEKLGKLEFYAVRSGIRILVLENMIQDTGKGGGVLDPGFRIFLIQIRNTAEESPMTQLQRD
jgi:hypothetical protein